MRDERIDEDQELAAAIAELEPLVDVSRASQGEILAFRERYDRLGRDAPLPPRSLREMSDGRRRYLKLQDRLVDLATRYAPLAEPGAPSEVDPLLRFQRLSVSLTAAVTLYDNYLSLLTILEDDRLRRLLAAPDFGYGIAENALRAIVDGLNSTSAQRRLQDLVEAWTVADEALAPTDAASHRLRMTIESSVSYRYAREASLDDHLPSAGRVRRARFRDALAGLGESTMGALSKVFGNGIGLIELRKGKLWQDEEVLRHLRPSLRPLDLLLEKTPFRLTDVFIPGHFGHVAIWMGTDEELDALGVWAQSEMQDEALRKCREPIREGRSVLEALRTGVELNRLEKFLNVDDLAVLRPTGLTEREVVASLLRGFRQVGKEYDFNFDVETTGSIVCSELPYHVYPGVDWETATQLGRFTISPDQVAAQALTDRGAFRLVTLYHDGALVDPKTALAWLEGALRPSPPPLT